ncbi:polyamine ABC transporter substrate-binding protein [Methylobrevis pamukkalensis]|uniref:Putrescine-binding periplasmic protein n=1 Tax=Methylobrevis pamukkalensis TaxID=1439726 RepID=A0A1E3GZV9_9HYPH|nr:polyamine ABC transporter substrate-binding protein [Methylobrevis pamukkalensis]ODN69618.1 Putrescine-binding periplasmic protein precursor [Methylobrevis pamukkalensis]
MRPSLKSVVAASIGGLLCAFAFAGAASAADRVVNVFNWSDYIGEETLANFEKETGIKVVYDVFDSNEVLETKLLAGATGYDVVVPTGTFLARQIQAGVFQKLDKSKLPNLQYQWPDIAERLAKYDPGNEHAVNYMWGTTGLGYNVKKIAEIMPDAPVTSLKMLFDPAIAEKFAGCGIQVLDAPDEMIPAALAYLGKEPDSKAPEDVEAAGEVLKAIRPFIQKFNSSEYINALANGDICLAFGWSGDILQSRDRAAEANNGVEIAYSIPTEGALMWFDNMAIPADAPHPEEALIFINYMMDPKVAAANSNYVFYANGSLGSQEFLDAEVKDDTAIYPTAESVKNLYTVTPWDPKAQRILTRTWTAVKTGS